MKACLRPYQVDAVESIRAEFRAGRRSVCLVMPTGAGKTFTFAYIAESAGLRGRNVLILAHRKELIRQASLSLGALGVRHAVVSPEEKVAGIRRAHVERFGWPLIDQRAHVAVASVQTLGRRLEWLAEFNPDLLIVDECHHSTAGTHASIIRACAGARVLGVTATPIRSDGRGLDEHFESMVLGPSMRELIALGALVPPRVIAPPSDLDLSHVATRGGDFDARSLAAATDRPTITGSAVAHYEQHSPGGRAIVFCASIAHAEHVAAEFQARGHAFETIHGGMDDAQRDGLIYGLADGRVSGLVSVDVISEGTDIPVADVAILLRATKSEGLFLQQCLDDQTEILTAGGWMRRGQVKAGDSVAAFDVNSGAAVFTPATSVLERSLDAREKMMGICSPHLDIRVTCGHDMVVMNRSKTSKRWVKERASKTSERNSMFKLPISGLLYIEDCNKITDSELLFIGWFLTDGTLNKRTRSISISQSAGKQEHCSEIRRVLSSCGFKFGEHRVKRTGDLSHCSDLIQFTVSYGQPRGRDKHLRGWSDLAEWVDKSVGHIFDSLSARQLVVLLSAMNLGDGSNMSRRSWARRTMSITFGNNELAADRIQALCVTRGLRANKSVYQSNGRGPWWNLAIRPASYATIAGTKVSDGAIQGKGYRRSRFAAVPSQTGEIVWCVENAIGTLFIRRNGKVAVVGNCGRVLRPADGKTHGLILDHVGNCGRFVDGAFARNHGLPHDDREWTLAGRKKRKRRAEEVPDVPIRQCPECYAVHEPAPRCPTCGHAYPVAERRPEQVDGTLREVTAAEVDPVVIQRAERRREQGRAETVEEMVRTLGYSRDRAAHILAAREEKERLRARLCELLTEWRVMFQRSTVSGWGHTLVDVERMKPKELRERIERVTEAMVLDPAKVAAAG